MPPTRHLLLAVPLLALSGCAQLSEQAAGQNPASDRNEFAHCTPGGSTCYQTAEDLARWGGHDHEPEPLPAPQPDLLPESSTDLVI